MKKCPKCKEEIANDAKKCKHCGADLRNWFARHKILTGVLAFILFIIIIGAMAGGNNKSTTTSNQSSTQGNTNNKTQNNPQPKVEVKSHKLNKSDYGSRSIVGEVVNNGNADASFVKVTATLYDSTNQVTGTNFTYAGDTPNTPLKSTATAPFEVIVMESGIVIDHYKLDITWN